MDVTSLVWIDAAGYHYADFPTFLAFVQGVYTGIYGADVYLGNDSQDGQWTTALAQMLYDTATYGAAIYNSFSPVTAQGTGLARVVKINGLEKQGSSFSTVQLDIGGTVGTTLTNAVAVDSLQQQWNIPSPTVIPSGGTITVTATAAEAGAVMAQPNTITGLFTPTNGWQTVNNPSEATVGVDVESDAALRVRQIASVALPALTVFESTVAAVRNVTGVSAAVGYENATGSTDGNGLPAHSIAVVVVGGDETAIAQAIQIKKTPGTETDGTTTVTVDDSHGMPIAINFYYGTPIVIAVQVTIVPGTGWVDSTALLILNAVSAAIGSLPNSGIGAQIILNQLYAPAYLIGTPQAGTFVISNLEIGILYDFVVSSANASIGATYTNNGHTFTVFAPISGGTELFCFGTGAPTASGTLTLASGTGDATITFTHVSGRNGALGTSNIQLLFNEYPQTLPQIIT